MTAAASQPDHDFHGFGHYDWCPDCRAAKAEQREIDDAANVAEITHLVGLVTDNVDDAERAIAKAKQAITDLMSDHVYDIEMVEGSGGTDVLIELATIGCSLRHVRRIMQERANLLRAEPDPDGQECKRCGDTVATLSTDNLCDGCIAEPATADGQTDDATALDRIQRWLRDPEYNSAMLEDIAQVVRDTGRTTANYRDNRSTWIRH